MKVKFVGASSDEYVQARNTLSMGVEYVVLEVFHQANGFNYFRIEYSRSELPPVFRTDLFEMVNPVLHSSWVFNMGSDGSTTIGPIEWCRKNFWEDLMNQIPQAVAIYKARRDEIIWDSVY